MVKALRGAVVDGLTDNDEKVGSFKNTNRANSREDCKNHTLFKTKMTRIDTLYL